MSENKHIHVDVVTDAAPHALVYRIHGVFGETMDAYRFLDQVREAMKSGAFKDRERIVFDLSNVEFLSSVGVGILAGCYTTATNASKSFVLSGLSKEATRVLQITGLTGIVTRYATEADAVNPEANPLPRT